MVWAERVGTQDRGEGDVTPADGLSSAWCSASRWSPASPAPAPPSAAGCSGGWTGWPPPGCRSCCPSRHCSPPAGWRRSARRRRCRSTVGWGPTGVATLVSFLVGFASIAWLLRLVAGHPITVFVPYRVALGVLVDRAAGHRRRLGDLTVADTRGPGWTGGHRAARRGRRPLAPRSTPVLPRTGGPAGNARLTAWTGCILFVLFLAELVTLLDVHGLISWHVALGVLLVPPALLKTGEHRLADRCATTRAGRPYVEAGPPLMALRVLGPLVVAHHPRPARLGPGAHRARRAARARVRCRCGQLSWVNVHQAFFVRVGRRHRAARPRPGGAGVHARRRAAQGVGRAGRAACPAARCRLAVLVLTLAVAGVDHRAGAPRRVELAARAVRRRFDHHRTSRDR